MLVMLMDEQIIAPQTVCQSCLLADRSGQPRWHRGRLGCGRALEKLAPEQVELYQCHMGFRVAKIE